MRISKSELISFKITVNEAAQMYGFTSSAALHVINVIKDYNKRGQLERELTGLKFSEKTTYSSSYTPGSVTLYSSG